MDLLSLPVVMIENILSYLSYDEIAKNRLVCRAFNDLSTRMLNRGFLMIERRHALALKTVKAQLPRRESERRYHPLARHCDILTSIETRISMLNMTYAKFIDCGVCCFIPGKVIDEIRRVLHIAETMKSPPRAHEVLQELRDISSMAIEHFDDKISPGLRQRLQQAAQQPQRTSHVFTPLAIRHEVSTLRRRSILNAKLSLYLATQYKKFHNRMMEYQKVAWRQRIIIRHMIRRQRRQESEIADLRRRLDECDIRYSEITHTRPPVPAITGNYHPAGLSLHLPSMTFQTNEVQEGGESPSPPLRHFGSQIKLDLSEMPIGTSRRGRNKQPNMRPRKPIIRMPSLSDDELPFPALPAPPAPSASAPSASPSPSDLASLKTRAQTTMAKIRGITNEIRQLSNMSKTVDGKKRPLCSLEDLEEIKRMKLE